MRCDPRAKALVANARRGGHTKREAIRILGRHLARVVWRQIMRDRPEREQVTW